MIPVFEGKDKFAPDIVVAESGSSPDPRARSGQAVVTELGFARLTGKRRAAKIATQPLDKRSVAPALAAKAEIALDHVTAIDASGGIKDL